jgi:chromosome segregation ATPase
MTVLSEKDNEMKERESSINDFIASFNEVERNLDSVASRQQILYLQADKTRGDVKASQKDKINAQIQAINDLMESNRATISDLKTKLKGSTRTNAKLRETIKTLQAQLLQKDQELMALNEKLASLNVQVAQLQTSLDTLTAKNSRDGKTIADNTMALHTAYYVVGRAKDLKDSKVIDRKGGLLGIGKTSQLSSNFDNSKFTKIDYTQTTEIMLNSDNVKIVTTHPADSYTFERDPKKKSFIKSLKISNPERFWSASKYLVIEGEKTSKPVSSAEQKEKGI